MNKILFRLLSKKIGAKFELHVLMRRTAKDFGIAAPRTAGLSAPELLRAYAQFTSDAAARSISGGDDLRALRRRLYLMAYRLGRTLCRWLRPRDERDCLAIITLLYRNIGIAIGEDKPGKFIVKKCYFSGFYTPGTCAVISAIDKGIFAGIYRGGKLRFLSRITEGDRECRADFAKLKVTYKKERERSGK
ncbi:MAG: hypothetical protein LUI02_05925 [Clostridiales bacterium]|nr:hypothetical protein [Clostridiales bacterium]